jgi:Na+/H+-dicarboxylate symporter
MSGPTLQWMIAMAIALAVAAGTLAGETASVAGIPLYVAFDVLGTLFVNALKMLVVPLVCSSMIVGVAGVGSSGDLGRLGLRTVTFFLLTTASATLMGMALVNAFRPGIVGGRPAGELLALSGSGVDITEEMADKGVGDLVDVLLSIVPTNVVNAAAGEDMLGLVFFSLLFGYFMARLDHSYADPLFRFWSGVFQIMMRITGLVMQFAPLGVFGLVARVAARTGIDGAGPLLAFSGVVLLALAGHALLTLPLLLRLAARVSPLAIYRAVSPAVLTAVATASSSTALPVTMECVQERAGVSNRVSSFVLPLGATANMNGTALYVCVAALFLAQAYGIGLDLATQVMVFAIAIVTSVGVPGVPSASLVAIGIIVSAIGLPVESIGVLFVFDRVLDMARTGLNVLGDAACAVIVARLEGEEGGLSAQA